MATETGMQAMQPVLFARTGEEGDTHDINTRIAQNENALNQNFSTLYNKLLELEAKIPST